MVYSVIIFSLKSQVNCLLSAKERLIFFFTFLHHIRKGFFYAKKQQQTNICSFSYPIKIWREIANFSNKNTQTLPTYIVLQTWKSQIKSIEPLNRKWNTSYVYHIVISMQTIANNWFLPTTTTHSHIQYYTKPQQTTEYLIRIYWYFAIVCFNAIFSYTPPPSYRPHTAPIIFQCPSTAYNETSATDPYQPRAFWSTNKEVVPRERKREKVVRWQRFNCIVSIITQ